MVRPDGVYRACAWDAWQRRQEQPDRSGFHDRAPSAAEERQASGLVVRSAARRDLQPHEPAELRATERERLQSDTEWRRHGQPDGRKDYDARGHGASDPVCRETDFLIPEEPMPITGIHHITLCASGAQEDVDFITKVMGLRLIKQT